MKNLILFVGIVFVGQLFGLLMNTMKINQINLLSPDRYNYELLRETKENRKWWIWASIISGLLEVGLVIGYLI